MSKRIQTTAPTSNKKVTRKIRRNELKESSKIFFKMKPVSYSVEDEALLETIKANSQKEYWSKEDKIFIKILPDNRIFITSGVKKFSKAFDVKIEKPQLVWRDGNSVYITGENKTICMLFTEENSVRFILENR